LASIGGAAGGDDDPPAQLGEIAVDDALEVSVKLRAQGFAGEAPQPGKSGDEDLVGVVLEGDRRLAVRGRPSSLQELGKAYRAVGSETLRYRFASPTDTVSRELRIRFRRAYGYSFAIIQGSSRPSHPE
jgi:hypothetical protein